MLHLQGSMTEELLQSPSQHSLGDQPTVETDLCVTEVGGVPSRPSANALLDMAGSLVERGFALTVLVMAAPLMLLIAIAIRLDSPGGAIFTQRRIARIRNSNSDPAASDVQSETGLAGGQVDGVPTFTIYKFRTYHTNSDHLAPKRASFEFDPQTIDHVHLQLKDDPRITRVGRFLRRSSLDELPNFINVLKGDMRLIGPRPEVREMFSYYTLEQRSKFLVKPGITGLAQVNGRGKLTFKETVEYDLWYVHNRSWRVDFGILRRTLRVVLSGNGSY